jgi:uncharacterized protein (TIGR02271 family)
MAKTVVALYRDYADAQSAVRDLIDGGIAQDRISLIRKSDEGSTGRDATSDAGDDDDKLDAGSGAVIGGATGAVIGGTAGAFLAGVAGLVIPGLGPLLGVGPLAATILGGAGIGAVSGGIAGALVNSGVSEEHAAYYQSGVEQGGTLVTVHADDAEAELAADILSRYSPLDVDSREEFASTGMSSARSPVSTGSGDSMTANLTQDRGLVADAGNTSAGMASSAVAGRGAMASTSSSSDMTSSDIVENEPAAVSPIAAASSDINVAGDNIESRGDEQARLPIVEEDVQIGKRQVTAGVARVRTRVYERPINESVTLREEKLNVERRATDRPLRPGEDAFQEKVIEVIETREEPVVHKHARVTGEVVVEKTATERTETVHDTVRKTDVEIDRDSGGMSGNQAAQSDRVLGSEGNTR